MPSQFHHLRISRPLCVLDCRTTGPSPRLDRVFAVSALRFTPGGPTRRLYRRVNPGVPIPAAAAAELGLTDWVVARRPPFAAVVPALTRYFDGADLAGFGLLGRSLPVLAAEFTRAGFTLDLARRNVIDVRRLLERQAPRDLEHAVRVFLHRNHAGAGTPFGNARATASVLDAMVANTPGLSREADDIYALLAADETAARLRVHGGTTHLAFGRYEGRPLATVARDDPGYLRGLLRRHVPPDFRAQVLRALELATG